jgi:hypothetical protein
MEPVDRPPVEAEPPPQQVVFAKPRKQRGNMRKRADDQQDDGAGDDGAVVRKAQKQRAGMGFTTKREDKEEVFTYESSNAVQQAGDGGATRALETETDYDRDARRAPQLPRPPPPDAAGGLAARPPRSAARSVPFP